MKLTVIRFNFFNRILKFWLGHRFFIIYQENIILNGFVACYNLMVIVDFMNGNMLRAYFFNKICIDDWFNGLLFCFLIACHKGLLKLHDTGGLAVYYFVVICGHFKYVVLFACDVYRVGLFHKSFLRNWIGCACCIAIARLLCVKLQIFYWFFDDRRWNFVMMGIGRWGRGC